MPKIHANNINIYYETHGSGDPIILISGLRGNHINTWIKVINTLSASYKVITLDNRGVGQTDSPDIPYTMEMMADDVSELMIALTIEKAHIIGFSMGGFVAQCFAAKYPEKLNKLILCATCVKVSPHLRFVNKALLNLVKIGTSPEIIQDVTLPWIFSDEYLTYLTIAKLQNCLV